MYIQDIDLIIDAYGLTHNVEWIRCRFGHLIPEMEDLLLIKEAAGRDICIKYKEWVFDWWELVFEGEIDPDFDFEEFVNRVKENQEELEKKIDTKDKKRKRDLEKKNPTKRGSWF